MTPNQVQRLEKKSADIRRAPATEKRKLGGNDDSRGLRYRPTRYYLQRGDYTGGLTNTRWFANAFADDAGFADFLVDWTVVLFKTGRIPEAQQKAWPTFCANTYVLDKFLCRPIQSLATDEGWAYAQAGFADYVCYSSQQGELIDFSVWLEEFLSSDGFISRRAQFILIYE